MGRLYRDERITITQSLTCGVIASITSRSVTSPLDVVKLLYQVGTKETQFGIFRTVPVLLWDQGVHAFFKGNLLACMRTMPYTAIQYATFQKIKLFLADEQGRLTAFKAAVAGSGGGIIATLTTYPTDLVKTRLTVQHTDKSKAYYKGIIDAFRQIARNEGIFAFYRGASLSVLGVVPFAAATFFAYELLDNFYHTHKSRLTPIYTVFLNGCFAAAFAQTLSYPFDTIRKKMQVSETNPSSLKT